MNRRLLPGLSCHYWRAFTLGTLLLSQPAFAQRTQDNATTAAEDGFGRSVGNESVGIYANGQVRGFSAADAGNTRIESLYIDEVGGITDLLQTGSDIHVGLTAFGKPFPAPTGIVDIELRRVTTARPVVTVQLNSGEFLGSDATMEAAIPLAPGLGINAALGYFDDRYADGGSAWFVSYGAVTRWAPAAGTEVTLLFSRYDYGDEEQGPLIYTREAFLPPRIERRVFFGQDWGQWSGHSQNVGGMVKSRQGAWTIEAGLFDSRFTQDTFASAWFDNVDQTGAGERFVLSGVNQRSSSLSGEVRLSRELAEGERLHRFIASLRGREKRDLYGGYHRAMLGAGQIGVPDPEPEPDRTYGTRTDDRLGQRTWSAGYELVWQGLGEVNLGLSRSTLDRQVNEPGLPLARRADASWLWNAALAARLTPRLTLYGATTRGLEESGTAPANATNANEVLPVLRTRQVESGLQWRPVEGWSLAASLFDLTKPYFEIDSTDGVFRILGNVRHRGLEMSLAGEPVSGLNLVAGAVLLDPVVTGEAVAEGRLGRRAIGRTATLLDASADWTPPGQSRLSLDARLLYEGTREADALNRFTIPDRATIDLGLRYRFAIGRSPALLRVKLANVTNVFGWEVQGGGGYATNKPRRLTMAVTADF